MENQKRSILSGLSIFYNREALFNEIMNSPNVWKMAGQFTLLLFVMTFAYGFVMGLYHSLLQAVVTGFKVPLLFLGTILICFPSFFIIQLIIGSKLRLGQMLAIILTGFLLMSVIMASFAPIILFFFLTGSDYNFLQLLHVGVVIFGGIFGMILILNALKYSCDEKGVYPKTGVTVFQIWVLILAFVGMQLTWNLRPFLGDSGQPFKLFRHYPGNFYTVIIDSARHLVKKSIDPNYEIGF